MTYFIIMVSYNFDKIWLKIQLKTFDLEDNNLICYMFAHNNVLESFFLTISKVASTKPIKFDNASAFRLIGPTKVSLMRLEDISSRDFISLLTCLAPR